MEPLDAGRNFLAERGLNLFAVANTESLPEEIASAVKTGIPGAERFQSLICIGNGGGRIWDAITEEGTGAEHPIDDLTTRSVERFIAEHLAGGETEIVFPRNPRLLSVQALGEWLGWVHPSPVGIGVSPEYGLWHAYRAVLLTTLSLPETARSASVSPCDGCAGKPCIRACPPGAVRDSVHRMTTFDAKTCAEFRLGEGSVCSDLCLARLACPVGWKHRYAHEFIRHIYGRSLPKMAAYLERMGRT